MPDIFTPEKRSDVMSKIKGKNTSLEMMVFRYLRSRNLYFQKHYKKAPGSPDVALPRKRKAVIIDGDFWHGWKYEGRKDRLSPFWQNKIETNIRRDRKNRRLLRQAGWAVLRVWEHDLRGPKKDATLQKIYLFLSQ